MGTFGRTYGNEKQLGELSIGVQLGMYGQRFKETIDEIRLDYVVCRSPFISIINRGSVTCSYMSTIKACHFSALTLPHKGLIR